MKRGYRDAHTSDGPEVASPKGKGLQDSAGQEQAADERHRPTNSHGEAKGCGVPGTDRG